MKRERFIIILAVLLFGCAPNRQTENVIIPVTDGSVLNMSDMFDQIIPVAIETTTASLIGDLSKLIMNDNRIYIFDRTTMAVSIFDMDGSFVSKIDGKGRGPGEYTALIDFDVFYDEIFLLDYTGRKIIVYDKECRFLRNIPIPVYSSQLMCVEDGVLLKCEYTDNENTPYVVKIDYSGNIIFEFQQLEPPGEFNLAGVPYFGRTGNDALFSKKFDNTFYIHKEDSFQHLLRLDFQSHNIPGNLKINSVNPFEEGFGYAFKYGFLPTDNWLVIDYFIKRERRHLFLNLHSMKYKSGKVQDDKSEIPFFPRWSWSEGLIGAIQPYELHEIEGIFNVFPQLKGLSPEDNPILLLFYIK